jgi:hypothetical protein
MLANILLGIGVLTGLLGLIDGVILNDKQKKRISDLTIQVWKFTG